ncbi:transcription termination factor 4, mitochondrial-like [Limulus polyphemus]|uniref:Transcription termination factor 4, mitochondrial-like n=1 Tax=Limulus polyphemus TaxID=6850 RepID=A0ABM1TA08_LIMPO|nr:transcription termination factor 4, mitochondrial-like [Limulus polyphemus]
MFTRNLVIAKNLYLKTVVYQRCFLTRPLHSRSFVKKSSIPHTLLCPMKRYLSSKIKEISCVAGIAEEDAKKLVDLTPQLLEYSSGSWEGLLKLLSSHGLSQKQIFKMLSDSPSLLAIKTDVVASTLDYWRSLKLGEARVFNILGQCPSLLLLKPSYLQKRIKMLNSLFTSEDILKLAETCPQVLVEPWHEIQLKTDYLLFVVGIEQPQIIKSSLLKYSLKHIKTRHQFALHSGCYRKPHGKHKNLVKNPSLRLIFNSSIKDFLKLSGLTVEEYTVFCELMEKKMKSEDEDMLKNSSE